MPTRIPGPSTPGTGPQPAPHGAPGAEARPEPPVRPGAADSRFARLKQRLSACLPGGGSPPGGAEASMRPRLRLPCPGEGPAQPTRGKLLWPNGHWSTGHISDTPQGSVFEPTSRRKDPVLAQRGRHKPAQPRNALPAALPVVARPGDPSGRQFVPRLPQVVTAQHFPHDAARQGPSQDGSVHDLLHAVGTPALERIVRDCAGTGNGLGYIETVALKQLHGFSLREVAAQCTDPQAAVHAAWALRARHCELRLECRPAPDGLAEPGFKVWASFDVATMRATLAALSAGEVWQVWVPHGTDADPPGHALAIGLQKQADGRVRLSVINSNGWHMQGPVRGACTPGVFKTLSQDEAAAAMQDLLSGGIPPRPADLSMRDWTFCALGRPLLTWFMGAGPADAGMSTDFHGTGRPLVSSPQKTGDCASECLFAFLATVLQPADYKLAKAACLNTLVQICDQLEHPGGAAKKTPLQAARRRLQERITTSLSGSMVASARPAPGR